MKFTKRTISAVLLLALMLNHFTTKDITAAKKTKPKLCKTKISIYTDTSKTIWVKNANQKAKWKIISGRAYIYLMQKKAKSVKIAGKKKGIAKVQATLGKRKLVCKVTVKEKTTEKSRTAPKSVPVYKPAPIPIRKPDSSSKPKVTAEPGILVASTEIDLYAIDSQNSKLEIPSDCSKQYQIKLPETGTAVYRIVSGKSAQVSDTGLITPVCTTYYWNGNLGSTVSYGAEGERITKEYRYETTILEAKVKQNI